MSNFFKFAKHPVTGEIELAEWLDDTPTPHVYSVKFADGTLYPSGEVTGIEMLTDEQVGQIAYAVEKIRDHCAEQGGWRFGIVDEAALAIDNILEDISCGNCGSRYAVCVGHDMNEAETYCCRECCSTIHHDECRQM